MKSKETECNHVWKYRYVRGNQRAFDYPFPVWVASRGCLICKEIEILKPNYMTFNSNDAEWFRETVHIGNPIEESDEK